MILLGGCSDQGRTDGEVRAIAATNFEASIDKVANLVGDLSTTPDALFSHRAFLEIYESPDGLADSAAALYANPERPLLHKEITGYAMQRLSLPAYVKLVSTVLDQVDKGHISAHLLDSLAFPGFNWGAQLSLRYQDPGVRKLLEKMSNLPQLSASRRNYIREQVLTGKARDDYLELAEGGQIGGRR